MGMPKASSMVSIAACATRGGTLGNEPRLVFFPAGRPKAEEGGVWAEETEEREREARKKVVQDQKRKLRRCKREMGEKKKKKEGHGGVGTSGRTVKWEEGEEKGGRHQCMTERGRSARAKRSARKK